MEQENHPKSEYIFATGAPGSRWSGVIKGIYYSPDINQSDYNKNDVFYFHEEDEDDCDKRPNHFATYFGNGQPYGTHPDEWDKPFKAKSKGIKIIKSHDFAYQLDYLTKYACPVIIVYRSPIDCFEWWHEAGGWNIKYPNYEHYIDDNFMFLEIENQCAEIQRFLHYNKSNITQCENPYELCDTMNISRPKDIFATTKGIYNHYEENDTKVYVWSKQ